MLVLMDYFNDKCAFLGFFKIAKNAFSVEKQNLAAKLAV